jgi:hypothetical protein
VEVILYVWRDGEEENIEEKDAYEERERKRVHKKKKMKKQRFVEKDYSRLSRTQGSEGTKGHRNPDRRSGSQVGILDQFAQRRGKQEKKERGRLLRRWSEKSIREELRRSGWKRGESQVRKVVNRGKWERDRGLRLSEKTEGQKKTGMYTRVGFQIGSTPIQAKERELVDRLFERKAQPKRRGRGRQDNDQRKWLGQFEGVTMPRNESERQIRRGRRKGRRSQELQKGPTLMDRLKGGYWTSRRKILLMNLSRRSRVIVSQEKRRKDKV